MDDAGNVTKDGQKNVDEQVTATSALEEDTQRRQQDSDDDLEDIAVNRAVSKGLQVVGSHVSVEVKLWNGGCGM